MSKIKKLKSSKFTLSNIILWMGLFFVLIPTLIIGYILLESTFQTGTVIEGNRFSNDLNPKIDQALITLTKEALNELQDVEVVEINLKAATLRITVKVTPELDQESIETLSLVLVERLYSVLPVDQFFTAINNQKMYDYEIIAYDDIEIPTTYFTIIRNARMEAEILQNILMAKNPVLVEAIQAKREEAANPLIPGSNGEEAEEETDEEADNG